MSDITLVNQWEEYSTGVNSCSIAMSNCTVGNTLILAYAVRGDGNIPTLSEGWEKIGGGNIDSDPGQSYTHRLYYASKKVENAQETITLTQDRTLAIYMVCGEFSGDFDIAIRNDMAKLGNDFTITLSKDNENDVMIYGMTSAYYANSGGRLQSCEPNDLEKLQGDSTSERLACWFDDGSGSLSHTFKTCSNTGNKAISECVQLLPKTNKYLVRDNDTIYTVQNDSLVEITGTLNAELFQTYGTDIMPDGTLLMTLANPEVLCWKDSNTVPKLKATVQGTPIGPHDVISDDIRIGHESIYGVASIDVVSSDGATFLLSFDNGAWMVYDASSNSWVASDVGMSATELVAIPTEAWSSVANSATTMQLKVTLDGVDTVTQVKFNFNNESPIQQSLESEGQE